MPQKVFVLSFIILMIQGCAFAPFSNNHTARSLGKHKISIQAGGTANLEVPYARIGYGISNNFDLGVTSELQFSNMVMGIWGKYAFINQTEGFSASIEASGGWSGTSTFFYAGPIIGYKLNWWEPYLLARYNLVNYHSSEPIDLRFIEITPEDSTYDYISITLGNTLWITKQFGLNINVDYAAALFGGVGLVFVF